MLRNNQSMMTAAARKRLAPLMCRLAAAFATGIWFPALCRATTVTDLSGHGHNGTLGVGFTGATSPTLTGSYATFTNLTDTIDLAGNVPLTNQATYEATVLFTNTTYPLSNNEGLIWSSYQDSVQDTRISIQGGGQLTAFSYPVNNPNQFTNGSLQTGVWYDLAYVYDGSQEREYVNGQLIASRAASGNISIGSANIMALGALPRDGQVPAAYSFEGDLASVRISNIALYSGSSYNAISGPGDFSDGASTQALYDFAPVPEPSSLCILAGFAGAGLTRRRRKTESTFRATL